MQCKITRTLLFIIPLLHTQIWGYQSVSIGAGYQLSYIPDVLNQYSSLVNYYYEKDDIDFSTNIFFHGLNPIFSPEAETAQPNAGGASLATGYFFNNNWYAGLDTSLAMGQQNYRVFSAGITSLVFLMDDLTTVSYLFAEDTAYKFESYEQNSLQSFSLLQSVEYTIFDNLLASASMLINRQDYDAAFEIRRLYIIEPGFDMTWSAFRNLSINAGFGYGFRDDDTRYYRTGAILSYQYKGVSISTLFDYSKNLDDISAAIARDTYQYSIDVQYRVWQNEKL